LHCTKHAFQISHILHNYGGGEDYHAPLTTLFVSPPSPLAIAELRNHARKTSRTRLSGKTRFSLGD